MRQRTLLLNQIEGAYDLARTVNVRWDWPVSGAGLRLDSLKPARFSGAKTADPVSLRRRPGRARSEAEDYVMLALLRLPVFSIVANACGHRGHCGLGSR